MQDLISIIIPVYNVEKYLRRGLDSVIKQTYSNLEIIAIDDGSTDSSSKILDEYAENYNNFKAYHIQNGGLSNARNEGMRYATGSLIGFIDPDDYIHPDMYKVLYSNLQKSNSDISIGGYKCVYDSDNGLENESGNYKDDSIISYLAINELKMILHGGSATCWKMLYKKEYIDNIKFESVYAEDAVFLTSVFSRYPSLKVVKTTNVLYYWYQRRGSLRTDSFNEFKFTALDAADRILEIVKENKTDMIEYAYIKHFKMYIGVLSQVYASNTQRKFSDKVAIIKENLKNDFHCINKAKLSKLQIAAYFGILYLPKLYGKLAKIHYRKLFGW